MQQKYAVTIDPLTCLNKYTHWILSHYLVIDNVPALLNKEYDEKNGIAAYQVKIG